MIDSALLYDNPLGDPARRPLWVYVPPGYDDGSTQRYPSIYVLQSYTGHLSMWRNRTPFRQPFPETADAVFATGDVPPAVVVFVDAWTAYGGSQFVDSPGTGRYHSYLCEEVVPFVDARYRTLADRAHRAISGKSSGGFGATKGANVPFPAYLGRTRSSPCSPCTPPVPAQSSTSHSTMSTCRIGGSPWPATHNDSATPPSGHREPGSTIIGPPGRIHTAPMSPSSTRGLSIGR